MARFAETEGLNGFQNWIVKDLYRFDPPETFFEIESILLIAIPHPMYSKVTVSHDGEKYPCLSLVSSDFDATRKSLESAVEKTGIRMIEAKDLPLKRLAVQSGFAVYGRNNITYIPGFGSCFSFIAFFTDAACAESSWMEPRRAAMCESCRICLSSCPTGAIREDSFLINNEICLSRLNESAEPFPDWLQKSAHHSLYDCLRCQISCPMNKRQLGRLGRDVDFDEFETEMLMAGSGFNEYPQAMKAKARYLGIDQWPEGIAKNVKTLIEVAKEDQP